VNRKAFTLIELLMVVLIMGILGSITVGGYRAMQRGMEERGVMENVSVSDIVAEGTESPIFIWLGNRARGYQEGVPVTKIGSIRGITLSDIRVHDAGPTGCSILGLPGHPIENVRLRNIVVEHRGGVGKTEIPADLKEKDYPEATMFGQLPAKGWFVRHARDVRFDSVETITQAPDERPEYVKIDVE
jgi:prepilin-type N-terminal cleavage/methylation domain-containing protein